ncbi:MAG: cell division protein FtsQ/DivIB, partial [Fimbriimonadales bacterium]
AHSPRIVGVPPTRSAWTGMSKPRVPIQEPTGKFTLPAPPAKPPRRRIRKSGIARKLFAWLWRNAEPLAWGATLSALAFSLWFSPRTQLTRLVVQGAPAEAQAPVEQVLRTHLRAPIALSDAPRHIEQALNALDWTRDARWRAAGVGIAHIQITPRTPEVLIESANGARIFADPTGFVFLPPNQDAKPLSGRIRLGQDYPTPQRGSVLNGEMRRAFTTLQTVSRRADVRNPRVLVSKTQGIRLWVEIQRGAELPTTLEIRFGDANALDTQLATLERILETPFDQLCQWEYVDVSTPSAEAVKPRRASVGGEL